jgi:hypothetical protein
MTIIFVVLEIKFTILVTYYIIKTCSLFTAYDRKFATTRGKTQNYKRGKRSAVTRN